MVMILSRTIKAVKLDMIEHPNMARAADRSKDKEAIPLLFNNLECIEVVILVQILEFSCS